VLRHYATSRKVAGSIPDEIIRLLNVHNPSSGTKALGFTASNINVFKSQFICNLYWYIQQIVYKGIQWHAEECSVALLCN
jgi:hypothetical protein